MINMVEGNQKFMSPKILQMSPIFSYVNVFFFCCCFFYWLNSKLRAKLPKWGNDQILTNSVWIDRSIHFKFFIFALCLHVDQTFNILTYHLYFTFTCFNPSVLFNIHCTDAQSEAHWTLAYIIRAFSDVLKAFFIFWFDGFNVRGTPILKTSILDF